MTWAEMTVEQKAVASARSYRVKLNRQLAAYAAEGKSLDTVLAHIAEQDAIIAANGGGAVASTRAARITSADPLQAYLAVKFEEMKESLRQQYYAAHPEAALPAALQNKTGKELQDYIAAERAKLSEYEKAVAPMIERDNKAAAEKELAARIAAEEQAAKDTAEAKRIKDIEDMNAVLKAKHSRH